MELQNRASHITGSAERSGNQRDGRLPIQSIGHAKRRIGEFGALKVAREALAGRVIVVDGLATRHRDLHDGLFGQRPGLLVGVDL